jgi:hypothetical protein
MFSFDCFYGVGGTLVGFFYQVHPSRLFIFTKTYHCGLNNLALALSEKGRLDDCRLCKAVFCRTSAPAAEARGADARQMYRLAKNNRTGPLVSERALRKWSLPILRFHP